MRYIRYIRCSTCTEDKLTQKIDNSSHIFVVTFLSQYRQ